MVREHAGPIGSLRDAVRARRLLWFFCRWCGHAERRDPRDLAWRLGRDLTFDQMASKLRCRRCRRLGKAAVFASEHGFLER
ncbi:MAG TPA: hypothetical protein VF113_05445 [Stellaceae bacterium]